MFDNLPPGGFPPATPTAGLVYTRTTVTQNQVTQDRVEMNPLVAILAVLAAGYVLTRPSAQRAIAQVIRRHGAAIGTVGALTLATKLTSPSPQLR